MEVNENILHEPSILQEKVKSGKVRSHPHFIGFLSFDSTKYSVSFLAIH